VDATLHLLATRNGQAVADKVANALHYPASPFVDHPELAQYTFGPVDSTVYVNHAFNWPRRQAAVWLYNGVGEVDLSAAIEAYQLTAAYQASTAAATTTVVSQHGLQLVPRGQAHHLNNVASGLLDFGLSIGIARDGVRVNPGGAPTQRTLGPLPPDPAAYRAARGGSDRAARGQSDQAGGTRGV
jgi:hypothetical protein